MVSRKAVGAVVGGLGLVLSSAIMGGAVSVPRTPTAPRVGEIAPWAPHLAAADAALGSGDVPRALNAWHAAYGAALASRRWEGFADAGDAYLRIGRASGQPQSGVPKARDMYLSALFRARDARSLDGVLRIASSFEALGDHEVSAQAMKMAHKLGERM